jgi:hypothetical protein
VIDLVGYFDFVLSDNFIYIREKYPVGWKPVYINSEYVFQFIQDKKLYMCYSRIYSYTEDGLKQWKRAMIQYNNQNKLLFLSEYRIDYYRVKVEQT